MKYEHIQDIFSRAAAQHSTRVAIECGSRHVTYLELEEDSNRLANFLLSEGAVKGSIVAIMAEKSVDVITAMIGVLKAGCAFAPLDSRLPVNRLKSMLAQIEPRWCIGDTGPLAGIDSEMKFIGPGDAKHSVTSKPNIESDPDQLCSIYFTSGSTGTPKPIAGRLKGISHFISWETNALGLEEGVRVSQLTAALWDAFLRDAFVPLSLGGTVCAPASRELKLDARALADWIDASRVNVVHCVPSLFRALINAGLESDNFQSLRYVLLSGEPLLPADVVRWTDVFGDRIRLVNLYGPTETTMTKLCYFVNSSDKQRRSIPIGKPMPGVAAAVVDAHGAACLPGEVGEILIRTPYRALGYYNQPELTAEVFVPNPLNNDPKDIVYRTGDYGRLLEDGNLEFVGRKDHQVKIRGVRVELAEVENVLRSHERVRDVAVIDREDAIGNKYLCAYVVFDGELEPEVLTLHAGHSLPEFMIPAAFISLDALPRNVNGKLDRHALPPPGADRAYVAPRNQLEADVSAIWAGVLGLERVGAHDNFFTLGGHSLLATQVISRVRLMIGVEVPLRRFFETPTVAGLSAFIQAEQQKGVALAPRIESHERTGPVPLSFAQQRLWFLNQLERNSPFYNVHAAVRMHGQLDVDALQRVFTEILLRHETLRTVFKSVEGLPLQEICPPTEFSLDVMDIGECDQPEQEAELLSEAEAVAPFDLSVGPLLRAKLLRLGAEDHVLVVTMHHIISDAWSIGVLIHEVTMLYSAFLKQQPSPLADLPVQYADFAIWQRNWLSGAVLEEQLGYWRKQLQDAPTRLELATDHPRPAVQTFNGATTTVMLPGELSESIKQLSQREGVTLFMTMLAAFQTLLYRYTAQRDIVVGSPIANRNRAEIEGLIGFFVNTLVMRMQLDGAESFRELLQRVREMVLDAHSHQDLPFEKLVEELEPERDLARSSLFQVTFVMQNAPFQSLELPGLTLAQMGTSTRTAKFDLTMSVTESGQGLQVLLRYNTDLFEAVTIERMLAHYQMLLEAVVQEPEAKLALLPLLTSVEQQLVRDWNETASEYRGDVCLHELFEEQVARTPERTAVIFRDQQLSFAELNARADQLARQLRRMGVGPEVRVALCMERSLDIVVAVLGILKAGGAYVPLDITQPEQRLQSMIEDAGATVVLKDVTTDHADQSHGSRACAGNLAYIIYTSGSTGTPKGVMVTHRSAVNLVHALQQAIYQKHEAPLRVSVNAQLSFDASVKQLLQLMSGHTLVIVPEEIRASGSELLEYLSAQKVDVLDCTPSQLQMLLATETWQQEPVPRLLLVGGESINSELWDRMAADASRDYYNVYGPTECTVDATVGLVRGETPNIGRQIANTRIYLLDAELNQVPPGVRGEICIAGDCLARGYLNRPDLTAERFVPDAYSGEAGARLYRTGDVARYRADGAIEFCGRLDEQVKLRGYRVELGEIEAVLSAHERVSEAVLVAREESDGEKRLVAYVVGDAETAELRQYLQERLPEYMIPTAWVKLDALPLTTNGKVDRKALLATDPVQAVDAETYIAPRTPTEETLASIWSEVLRVERIGIHDNFFALGGHSLLATQVIVRVRSVFNVEMPIRRLFEAPTIAGMAVAVVQQQASQVDDEEMAQIIAELEYLSDDDALSQVSNKEI